jgi:hypothetical protein
VFPCAPWSKKPATTRGVRDATVDRDIIERWWRREPNFNIAVACGTASGIFAVDVDDFTGEAALEKLEFEHGPLPPSVEVITPRPGRHIYFRMPATPVRNSTSKIGPHLDIRASGGYTILPPSRHPTGKLYAWSVDSAAAFAEAPQWLLHLIAAPAPTRSIRDWRQLVVTDLPEGARNSTITQLCGHILRHGVDVLVALELLQAWNSQKCQPPLAKKDIETIVDSIAGRELKRRSRHG